MNNVVSLETQDAIEDEASLWIAKLDRGLSMAEEVRLKAWVNKSASHRKVLFEMAELWDKMDSLSRLASIFEHENTQQLTSHRSRYPLAFAASFVIGLCAVLVAVVMNPLVGTQYSAQSEQIVSAKNIYETAIGEYSTVSLNDGSELTLNTNTKVLTQFLDDRRILILERGELHIQVAHDKTRPLTVVAGNKLVQAVGTAFNVELLDADNVELIVTDGKVLVAEGLSDKESEKAFVSMPVSVSRAVKKGEKVFLGAGVERDIVTLEKHEISAGLSWQQGNLVFTGESLEEAVSEISRYSSKRFEFVGDEIRSLRIAGLFKAGDVDGLLLALEKNFGISSSRVDDTLILLERQ